MSQLADFSSCFDAKLGFVGADEAESETAHDSHVFWLRDLCGSARDCP